jgi:hypothetical protein
MCAMLHRRYIHGEGGEVMDKLTESLMALDGETIDDLRRKLENAEAIIGDCEDAANKGLFPTQNEGVSGGVSIWRRIELAGSLLSRYRVQLRDHVAKLAASSLANAALRTALESIEHKGCTEDAHVARAALDAALPADSLAQEVVWLLDNVRAIQCADKSEEWWTRRNALLDRMVLECVK